MKSFLRNQALRVCVGLLAIASTAIAADRNTPIDQGMIDKITAALPTKPRVAPAAPRKLLVFTLCKGYWHSSIPYGTHAVVKMGELTGAYTATHSEDPAVFAPESLAQFDAVCMLNTTSELFDDPALKQSLMDFVKGGKGIVGIHAATDCFYEWAEYGEMMGGYFDGHPWGSNTTVVMKLDDPSHPLNQAFSTYNFTIKDEIYQYKEPYTRENLRILYGLDTTKTDMNRNGIKRTDNDFAVSWCRNFGNGRVFYSNLGHNESTYWNTPVMQQFLDGIQYAFGDIAADATPSAQLTPEYLEQSRKDFEARSLTAVISEVGSFEYGKAADSPETLSAWVVEAHGNVERERALAKALCFGLNAATTHTGRDLLAKQLHLIATEEDVPEIARLLSISETADFARYAIDAIPGAVATQALIDALPNLDARGKIGIMNSLGERGDSAALAALGQYIQDSDPALADAALWAIGRTAGKELPADLWDRIQAMDPGRMDLAERELLLALANIALHQAEGDTLYRLILDNFPPDSPARGAAFVALVEASGEKGPELLVQSLREPERYPADVAGSLLRSVKSPTATQVFMEAEPTLPPASRVMLLLALGDRGDVAALPNVANATADADVTVKNAALSALGKLGNATVVATLVLAAATGEGETKEIAAASLARIRGLGVDGAIIKQIETGDAAIKIAAIQAAVARQIKAASVALLVQASNPEEAVAAEALSATGQLAKADVLPHLVKVLLDAPSDAIRDAATSAYVSVAERREGDRTAELRSAIDKNAGDAAKQVILLSALGKIGDPNGLPALRAAAVGSQAEAKDAAIRAIANWPTADVLDDLMGIATNNADPALQALALRGYVRLVSLPSERGTKATIAAFQNALPLAKSTDDVKLVLAGLGTVRDTSVAAIVEPYLQNEETKAEAQLILDKLKEIGPTAKASVNDGEAAKAIDGDVATRWATNTPMTAGQWFMLDLGWEKVIKKVTIDAASSGGDYPRGYALYVTADDANWGEPVATGAGEAAKLEIAVPAKSGRFIKIVQTGSNDLWWSIHEITVEAE